MTGPGFSPGQKCKAHDAVIVKYSLDAIESIEKLAQAYREVGKYSQAKEKSETAREKTEALAEPAPLSKRWLKKVHDHLTATAASAVERSARHFGGSTTTPSQTIRFTASPFT